MLCAPGSLFPAFSLSYPASVSSLCTVLALCALPGTQAYAPAVPSVWKVPSAVLSMVLRDLFFLDHPRRGCDILNLMPFVSSSFYGLGPMSDTSSLIQIPDIIVSGWSRPY